MYICIFTSCSQFKYHIVLKRWNQQKLRTTYIEIKLASMNSAFFPSFYKTGATWTMQKKNEEWASKPNKQNDKKEQWQICCAKRWESEQSQRQLMASLPKTFQATLRFVQLFKYVCSSCNLHVFFSRDFQCTDKWHNIFVLHHLGR